MYKRKRLGPSTNIGITHSRKNRRGKTDMSLTSERKEREKPKTRRARNSAFVK